MKLAQVLGQLNQIEKSKFINSLDRVCQSAGDADKKLAKELNSIDGQLKSASSNEITRLFFAVRDHYIQYLRDTLALEGPQLTLLTNILSRDGNCVARTNWIEALYDQEHKRLSNMSKALEAEIKDASETDRFDRGNRLSIYQDCFKTAYFNDERVNRQARISDDERMILNILMDRLDINRQEAAAIEHLIVPVPASGVLDALNTLREYGVVFISKRNNKVFVPDEVVQVLNGIQGKALPDKYLVRILRSMSDPELSNVLKAHDQQIRGVHRQEKINYIIRAGFSVHNLLAEDMHDPKSGISERKDRLKTMIDDLNLEVDKLGSKIEERIELIVSALNAAEEGEFNSLTSSGFKEMLTMLETTEPPVAKRLQETFEIEPSDAIDTETMRALSISPVDILYLYSNEEVKTIRSEMGLSKRKEPRMAILESFASATDKIIENYELLAQRDLKGLDTAGVQIREPDLGAKFEEATRALLGQLGLNVDEDLRKQLGSAKDKMDIVVSLSDDDVIVGEAKSFKSGEYSKYSSTSRQVKAYVNRCEAQGKRVQQVLLVAPAFSQDFIEAAELDADVNISLLEATGLKKIVEAYKARRNPKFTAKLLTKGGLLKADLIAKSI
ncbi:hypothetical protein HCH_03046 [Hahella chejuensis KCTC 2396]|uniref:Uncharacterized protein n=1 Tax=Hahella chejuensis (strain KCTC 2396) TaxID=349521 RepID=Q2SHR2_HAHCH|nr:hypothetical protein [Hahella chejuensis]ABC29812.1 hypothetical protein HCH_03046 [Hahella chejuensis KCTC 2396]